ncbi:MAG: trypsin-like serine protease [Myxococcales bacterium]|nr:trypsin-like serine protease [Deltaproteobacteria bacterium]NND27179.1 trypsin-like serine protease [Myxococcales bacterium]NNL25290.1 trypsin-like serine protease [Myxococcales bacterium]RZV50047.1 MAG: trypsin-like serine protease [Deltaproteobacteria bacterium]
MLPPKAYKALFVTLLGTALGCGDVPNTADWDDEIAGTQANVVGGWAANDRQIFATVEIRHTGASVGFCSGALISPGVVVTAAHCAVVEPEVGVVRAAAPGTLEVVAGHLASRSAHQGLVRPVSEARVHEGYDHDFIMGRNRSGAGQGGIGSPNDIALLLLDSPFDEIPNAPLLSKEREHQLVRHGDVGFVAGYGVYDLEENLNGELYISDAVIDILGQNELLTRRIDQLGDSCYGDSGGPLYVPTEEGNFLVGLVSRGRSDVKRDCGDGGVYTLLSAHLPWIADQAGSRFQPSRMMDANEGLFLEDGADPISVPKGGTLNRASACAAVRSDHRDRSPISALGLLLGVALLARRLSGV